MTVPLAVCLRLLRCREVFVSEEQAQYHVQHRRYNRDRTNRNEDLNLRQVENRKDQGDDIQPKNLGLIKRFCVHWASNYLRSEIVNAVAAAPPRNAATQLHHEGDSEQGTKFS